MKLNHMKCFCQQMSETECIAGGSSTKVFWYKHFLPKLRNSEFTIERYDGPIATNFIELRFAVPTI